MAGELTPQKYNSPVGQPNTGTLSTIGEQFNTQYWIKKALIEAAKEQYFSQMASTTSMPKHYGKKIVRYEYIPLLDDQNVNDQGIDAAGNLTPNTTYWVVKNSTTVLGHLPCESAADPYADAAGALAAWNAEYPDGVNFDGVMADSAIQEGDSAGNLYGSSKDVGTITAKMPSLSETGGRVNRVGFTRLTLEGTFEKFGFFNEYTKESVDFDTDSELQMHINREMIMGANEMTEDSLQIDLLNAAGVTRYGGSATSKATISGETGSVSLITYEDLMRLSIDLDENRCPKNTKIITGSRMVDTRVIDAARYMYIGSELIPMFKRMVDLFDNQAFIPVQAYGAAGNIARGEIGSVDQFRIIVVPEMMHWAGGGGAVTTNDGYRETGGNYDVYPALVVGSESFTTIGFQTDGKTVKFKIKHVKPESSTSYSFEDPFGEKGFMSIKWYYGFMVLRPERIALCLAAAEL